MDARHFDTIVRALGRNPSRRAILGALTGLLAHALSGRSSVEGARCIRLGQLCDPKGETPCCAGSCCGGICCIDRVIEHPDPPHHPVQPPEPTPPLGPPQEPGPPFDQPSPPFDPPEPGCGLIGGACETHAECCTKICCGGSCSTVELCVCPEGTACAGDARCESYGRVYTTEGSCCSAPSVSYCLPDSDPRVLDGDAGCCLPGVDCPRDLGETRLSAQGGSSFNCPTVGVGDDDCCYGLEGGDAAAGQNCVALGRACHADWPCCGKCVDEVCVCLDAGDTCVDVAAGVFNGPACCAGLGCVFQNANQAVCA
jgi:hypothetical protein